MRKLDSTWNLTLVLALALGMTGLGCKTRVANVGTAVDNSPTPSATVYRPVEQESGAGTADIESNDVVNCAEYLVGKMLQNPLLVSAQQPRVVILDAKYFTIDTTQRLDKDLLINRLRTELINAANGRIRFAGRQNLNMVEEEKELKAEGVVGGGTTPGSATALGADYRLTGSVREIATNVGGRVDKYTLMTFEMIDLATSEIVFSDQWEFKKVQSRPSAYR